MSKVKKKKLKLNFNSHISKPFTSITKTLNKNYNNYCYNKFYLDYNNFIK